MPMPRILTARKYKEGNAIHKRMLQRAAAGGQEGNENGKQLFSKAGVRLTLRAKHMYRKQLFSMADAW